MAQLDTQILPLLPLTSGVVLPGMVVTLTIESDEARRALAASESSGGELLLVPRIGSSYAKIGTVAKVEDVGRLRSGLEALVIRGVVRAVVGTGVAGTGETTWVQFEPRPDPDIPSERSRGGGGGGEGGGGGGGRGGGGGEVAGAVPS
jgi:ATP-dependent Lon protease